MTGSAVDKGRGGLVAVLPVEGRENIEVWLLRSPGLKNSIEISLVNGLLDTPPLRAVPLTAV